MAGRRAGDTLRGETERRGARFGAPSTDSYREGSPGGIVCPFLTPENKDLYCGFEGCLALTRYREAGDVVVQGALRSVTPFLVLISSGAPSRRSRWRLSAGGPSLPAHHPGSIFKETWPGLSQTGWREGVIALGTYQKNFQMVMSLPLICSVTSDKSLLPLTSWEEGNGDSLLGLPAMGSLSGAHAFVSRSRAELASGNHKAEVDVKLSFHSCGSVCPCVNAEPPLLGACASVPPSSPHGR